MAWFCNKEMISIMKEAEAYKVADAIEKMEVEIIEF